MTRSLAFYVLTLLLIWPCAAQAQQKLENYVPPPMFGDVEQSAPVARTITPTQVITLPPTNTGNAAASAGTIYPRRKPATPQWFKAYTASQPKGYTLNRAAAGPSMPAVAPGTIEQVVLYDMDKVQEASAAPQPQSQNDRVSYFMKFAHEKPELDAVDQAILKSFAANILKESPRKIDLYSYASSADGVRIGRRIGMARAMAMRNIMIDEGVDAKKIALFPRLSKSQGGAEIILYR